MVQSGRGADRPVACSVRQGEPTDGLLRISRVDIFRASGPARPDRTTTSRFDSSIPCFRPEPVFRRNRPPRATSGGIRNRRWSTPPTLSGFALVGCGEPRCNPPRVPGLQQASPRPTPVVPRVGCLGETVSSRVASASRDMSGTDRGALQSTATAACHAEGAGAGARHRGTADYCLEQRHPAARASLSEQNHRSPFDVLIRVANSVKPYITQYLPPLPSIRPTRLVSNVVSSLRSHSSRFDAVWT